MSLFGFPRRAKQAAEGGGEWGIYLAYQRPRHRATEEREGRKYVPGLNTFATRARLSAREAERLLSRDPAVQFDCLIFGRWNGGKFEQGEKLCYHENFDVGFRSPDGFHTVRLKCPPWPDSQLNESIKRQQRELRSIEPGTGGG